VGTLVIFAFVAGFFIIGLTLYSAAIDRVKDYGTMKAIGATNGFITRLIYLQAGIFAVLGFLIGYGFILGFKQGVAQSGLTFDFKPVYLGALVAMILFIAVGGATFAARRISKLEPASVFR
jgi:putative ABC transport system permease protein